MLHYKIQPIMFSLKPDISHILPYKSAPEHNVL